MYYRLKTHLALTACLLFANITIAQNIIKNPSFEEYVNCPKRLGNFNADVVSWSTPTEGSTDYFNGCSTAMGTPKNFNGTQPADFGKGYAGLYLYAPNDYREYLQAELSETLVKGETYQVSFYVSLAERSDFAIKEFGVLFSKDRMSISGKKPLSKKKMYQQKGNDYNYMEIGYSNFYSDTKDWILVHTQFTAKGTERFLTMGNFKSNARTRMFKTKRNAKQGAYYYVDLVLVEPVATIKTSKNNIADLKSTEETYSLDKTHVFENLLFDFDKFKLHEESKKEMLALYKHLNSDRTLYVSILGHTDSVGSDSYNQKLSARRAQVVAQYLQKLGLSEDRIVSKGHGGKKPIATNDSENGRRQNRRVEFVITKRDMINK
ncbi:OmpA family protein [Maribacter algarum]|uniref:OmpA family protein n=1 Tax=Maribacter algarum (ex Zhang et al. 2020) TaxID=2578118 RepID=A0A5S3PXI2_9FLAO|nr:OmpA family protein [Maribacter algarum]TMM57977.1 OmpA family protein [Maribacter algarum]